MTMNSWKSVESWACLPPLRMLNIGTGRVRAADAAEVAVQRQVVATRPPRGRRPARRRGSRWRRARPCSACRRARSAARRCRPGRRRRARAAPGRSCRSTLATARRTPLPPYRPLSPSRSSTASCAPVDAPDGTAARPTEPSRGRRRPRPSGCRANRGSRARRRPRSMVLTCAGLRPAPVFAGLGDPSERRRRPGSSRPSRNSSDAPPPVEMWVIRSARPCCGDRRDRVAAADDDRRAGVGPLGQHPRDRPCVPWANDGISNTPSGPFQKTVFTSAERLDHEVLASPCRGRRCATRPGSSRPGASCTRCRG